MENKREKEKKRPILHKMSCEYLPLSYKVKYKMIVVISSCWSEINWHTCLEFSSKGLSDSHLEVAIVSRIQLCTFRKKKHISFDESY